MLSMYFYGYVFTMIPAGIMANRFGGKLMWEIGIVSSGLCTLLTPVGARLHAYVLCALRFLLGMSAGFCLPASHTMWGKWSPPLERSKLVALTFCGPSLGTIMTFSISGFLCAYGFDNGWGSIFYLIGIASLIWAVSWWYLTADSPQQHRHISQKELRYIEKTIGYKTNKKTTSTPWLRILKSSAVWGCGIAHVCFAWTVYTLGTSLPSFMQEVLKFDIRENGLLSSLPYITNFVGGIISGHVADHVRSRGTLKTGNTRKVVQTVAFVGASACFSTMGFFDCHQRNIVVVLLCISTFFHGLSRAGFQVNYVDFAPRYAGVLFAIANTAACIPGTFAPTLVGILTPNKSQEEWRNVFFVCAGISMFGTIFFVLFASGEVQDWAKEAPKEHEIVAFVGEYGKNHVEKAHEDFTDEKESQLYIKLVRRSSLDGQL